MRKMGLMVYFILFPWVVMSSPIVKVIHHEEGHVYRLSLSPLYATRIRFHDFGRIQSIYCGDPAGWDVQVSQDQRAVIVKPRSNNNATNLIIDFRDRSILIGLSTQANPVASWFDLEFYRSVTKPHISLSRRILNVVEVEYVFRGESGPMTAWGVDD